MSVTSARTLQMRRSVEAAETSAILSGFWEDFLWTVEGFAAVRSRDEGASLTAEKSPAWPSESGPAGKERELLGGRCFARRARRLASVGGLSSLSGIPPESSIATHDFRASGEGG